MLGLYSRAWPTPSPGVPRHLGARFAYLFELLSQFLFTPLQSDRPVHLHSATTAAAMATPNLALGFPLRDTCGQLPRHLIISKTRELKHALLRDTLAPRTGRLYAKSATPAGQQITLSG